MPDYLITLITSFAIIVGFCIFHILLLKFVYWVLDMIEMHEK